MPEKRKKYDREVEGTVVGVLVFDWADHAEG